MRVFRRLLRVVVVVAGLLLLPGRPNVAGRPALSLCASESASCVEEFNSFCSDSGTPMADKYWKAEP